MPYADTQLLHDATEVLDSITDINNREDKRQAYEYVKGTIQKIGLKYETYEILDRFIKKYKMNETEKKEFIDELKKKSIMINQLNLE